MLRSYTRQRKITSGLYPILQESYQGRSGGLNIQIHEFDSKRLKRRVRFAHRTI
jgi:hypothetical protein